MQQSILAILFTSTFALAQGVIYVPDNQAAVGTCNAIPLSSGFSPAMTYVGRIPASFLNPNERQIQDIQFAPCTSTVFSAVNLQMGIGHVLTPAPIPFAYPTFDAAGNVTALGSFLDYRPLWNSVAQGPFSYTMTADTWSPLGFAATSGTGFTWDAVNDIGWFITYDTGSGGAPCHRTATEPFRYYAYTYQAGASTGAEAAGLKMGLVTGWPRMCAGCGPLTIAVTGTSGLGGALNTSLGNAGSGAPFIGLGFGPFCVAPLCSNCIIGHGWQVAIFGTAVTMPIPNHTSYLGMQVGFQGAGLMTPGGCSAPLVSLSDTVVVQITP